ncbi:Antirestriction protein ArdC (plasmid) [Bradyrhizobium guangxiense]
MVVYANKITKTETDEHGDDVERTVPFLRAYTVFCVDQIDDLPDHYYRRPAPTIAPAQRIAHVDAFFANTGATIRHGGDKAFFAPSLDLIQMPPFESFRDAESYAATLAHECVHWTAPPHRVNRDLSRYAKDRNERAREELIAEPRRVFPQCGSRYRTRTRAARRSRKLSCVVVGGAVQREAFHLFRGRPRSAGSHLSARCSTQAGRDRPSGMRRNDPCLGRLPSSFTFLDMVKASSHGEGRSLVHRHAEWRRLPIVRPGRSSGDVAERGAWLYSRCRPVPGRASSRTGRSLISSRCDRLGCVEASGPEENLRARASLLHQRALDRRRAVWLA